MNQRNMNLERKSGTRGLWNYMRKREKTHCLSYLCVMVVSVQATLSVPLMFSGTGTHLSVIINNQNASWHEFGLCQPKPSPALSLGMIWQLKCSQLLEWIRLCHLGMLFLARVFNIIPAGFVPCPRPCQMHLWHHAIQTPFLRSAVK